MATKVNESEEIVLDDGVTVEIKPLVIGRLRKFMDRWEDWTDFVGENQKAFEYNSKHSDDKDFVEKKTVTQRDINKKQFDLFIDLCVIALKKELQGERTDSKFKEYLEDVLDQPTIYRVLKVCGELDLAPENLAPMLAAFNDEAPDGEI